MKVFHINDKLDVAGGVEVCIRDTITGLTVRGVEAQWIALRRRGEIVDMTSGDATWIWSGAISDMGRSPLAAAIDKETLFHVHSLSEPALMDRLFDLGPVLRHMHEPRVFCPGQGKFWAKTETICTLPYGLHCFAHAYTQRCCNRHPKRLWHQYSNTRYEVQTASGRYAKMIANSTYTKEEAVRAGIPEDRIVVLNNFTHMTPEPDWDAPQPPVIAFAGRLSRTKGLHILLDAFAQVLRKVPEARLEILGRGHDEKVFFRQADALSLGEAVQFHGWGDKAAVDALLSRAAMVAFPSIYPEAFGITGIEAMMRGKPVVAFDVGGVSDWLRHEETGLFAAKDAGLLAAALVRLLSDRDLRQKLGRQARARAVTAFAAEPHLSALVGLYRSVLGT
ncbi:glycosyltransferase family 4 protein [Thioclava pacifica]|uniref:Glycosyl transferase family 1 domain-containing protein n=1 Tax=Thioclava pacifica DSM 10166 TaxID=1353537 RepID=A0A074JZE7_9RHOB|nr:glycosyltransferase family 4 protein [Thioclava pacifica]KEO54702.1 hypothetical protein TP2_17355 [Thioclava pacifica DSM 10166]